MGPVEIVHPARLSRVGLIVPQEIQVERGKTASPACEVQILGIRVTALQIQTMAEPFRHTCLKRIVVSVETCFADIRPARNACEGQSLREIFVRRCGQAINRILWRREEGLIELKATGKMCRFGSHISDLQQ